MQSKSIFVRQGLVVFALGTTAITSPLLAQEEETTLEEVVLTASGFEQLVKDAPASVSVISGETLRKSSVTSLADALRGVQGVAVTGVAAEQDITIRGLPGQYTLILVDGKRQGTRESRPNGSAGWEQSFIPPVEAIERIEVVRGPMSSLYGSDAVGGVINIITKPVAPEWSGSVTLEGTLPASGKDGAQQQGSFYLSGPVMGETLGLQLWGRMLKRQESRRVEGVQGADDRDLTGRLTWQLTETQSLALEAGTTDVTHDASAGLTLEDGSDNTRQTNRRDHISLTHKADFGAVQTELSFSQEKGERDSWTETDGSYIVSDRSPEIENRVIDGKATTGYSFGGEHKLIAGFQVQESTLTDQNPGLGTTVEEFETSQWSVFAEDEWALTDELAVTFGVRQTEDENFGSKTTPRLYGVWNPTEDLTIKGGVSTGYRTPDIRQSTDGYYYTTERGAGVIVSNPDLVPEESTNYELGAQWAREGVDLGVTLFQTDFKNKIESGKTDETIVVGGTTYNRWEYYNINEARMRGVELTGRFDLTPDLQLMANYTYTDSEQKTGDYAGLPLTRTPEHMASLRLDWVTPVDGLEAWAMATYRGSEVNSGARIGSNGTPYAYAEDGTVIAYKYGAYTTVDLGVSYAMTDTMTVNAAVYNVSDRLTTAADNNSVNAGRRVWLGLTSTF